MYRNKTKIWAHRGASGHAPENTMEAFKLAVEQGADGVELDVQMTKDGHLVVIHDECIDRVSDGTGFVKDYLLEELRSFHFNKTHPEYTSARIPTLEEVYSYLKPYGMTINVELKTGIFWYEGIEEAVVKLTREMGLEDQVLYSSFNHLSIARVKELDPRAHTAILFGDVMADTVGYAERLGVEALHPCVYHMRMRNLMGEWVNSSLDVNVWTVNDPEDMKMLMKAGVHAVITNYPEVAAAVRREMDNTALEE
ncbi:MAG: glycerophosphodiester phosphodiesterase [Candidatus Limivivens sp.]|nr:glycerophosphodiester phosphodiesterase [Candidatus Limivivens sp.]